MANSGYVYFMRNETTGLIKIGYSQNIKVRRKALSRETKANIVYLGCVLGTRDTERTMHNRFQAHRVGGEWFHCDDEIIGYIQEYAFRDYPPPLNKAHETLQKISIAPETIQKINDLSRRFTVSTRVIVEQSIRAWAQNPALVLECQSLSQIGSIGENGNRLIQEQGNE